MKRITASTPLYGLFGHPAKQSLSPILQNGWIDEHGFDGVYMAFETPLDSFESSLSGLYQVGLQGANVTSPFKEQAAAAVLNLTDRAARAKSVNTLVRTPQGFDGDSTDGAGFITDLDRRADGWRDKVGPIVLLGAGGAARALFNALVAEGCNNIRVINRTLDRARELASSVIGATAYSFDQMSDSFEGATLVINATSAGLEGANPITPDFSMTRPDALVYDTIYAPRMTAFRQKAQDQKRQTLDGLGMLVGQGALAFEAWFGVRPDMSSGLARLEAELLS
jgi:shikimate dehydrogenase